MSGSPAPRPLRILFVITRMIVGGAQETALLSSALIDRQRFPSELLTGAETGSEGELHTEALARGVVLHVEPSLVRDFDASRDITALLRLTRFMKRGRYDIVHTHSSKAGVLGRIAARLAGVPVVVHTVHGWAFTPGLSRSLFWLFLVLERVCARLSDRIIVVAEANREDGLALRIGRPAQYQLIRSGIEIEAYRDVAIDRVTARARLGLPGDALVVGSVGRLSPQKAPLDLVTAFGHVARVEESAHLVMVGDGPLRGDVEAAVRNLGLVGRVHLLGLRRDVPELLRAFDVFALASKWEGLPRVFFQAMAAGLPIVATRVDGASDAITPGENGWLVEVGDEAGLADRLLALARDPAARQRMGECGRQRADEFSAPRMVDQLEELYERLAVQKGLIGSTKAAPKPTPGTGA
jgi:glycosyltransferase involved in cell wall biosynthesis